MLDALIQQLRDVNQRLPERQVVVVPATPDELTAFEGEFGPLPSEAWTFFLTVDFAITTPEGYVTLSFPSAVDTWRTLAPLAANPPVDVTPFAANEGVKDGRVEQRFFHHRWLPLATDAAGNLVAVDCAPGPRGHAGQVLWLQVAEGRGPFATGASSLTDWLAQVWSGLERQGLTTMTPAPQLRPWTEADARLSSAIFARDVAGVRSALAEGAWAARRDPENSTPLLLAVMEGADDIAHLLLHAAPDTAGAPDAKGYPPLSFTTDPALVRSLVRAGADPNASWDDGRTALYRAAEEGAVETVRALIEAGAKVNVRTTRGLSAAAAAAWAGAEDAVLALLDAGASPQDEHLRAAASERGLSRVLQRLHGGS